MAQIVETSIIGNPGSLGNLFEMFNHCSSDKIFSYFIGKDEIELVVPHIPSLLPIFLLSLQLFTQSIHNDGRRKNGTVLTAFGRFQKVIAVFALQLLLDGDDAGFEIHARPGQTQQFALAHTGEHSSDEQIAVIVLLCLFQQPGNFFRLQRLDLRFDDLWQFASIGRVARNIIAGDCLLQGTVQNSVKVLDRLG